MRPLTVSQRMPQPRSSLSPAFRRARSVHDRCELDQAERLYAEILRRDPAHFDALHLLAMLNYQRGRNDTAAKLLRAALRIDGGRADAQSDLGLVCLAMGGFEDALASYDAAHAIAPRDPDALNGRGVALLRLGSVLAIESLLTVRRGLGVLRGLALLLGLLLSGRAGV